MCNAMQISALPAPYIEPRISKIDDYQPHRNMKAGKTAAASGRLAQNPGLAK
jgi:hypothetical protein